MPQENYTLIDFKRDESLENLRKSPRVLGGTDDEDISYTKGVILFYIKVKNDTVSFSISPFGKLQISHSNAELLRRAKSQLSKLIICKSWRPTDESFSVRAQDLRLERTLQEADRVLVLKQIDVLKETNDSDIIEHRLQILAQLAHKRMAHIPDVLDFFDTAFKDDKFKKNNKILGNLIRVLYLMLGRERYDKPNNYLKKVERIQGKPLTYVIEIMEGLTKSRKRTDSNVLYEGIYFLRQTDKKESVDALFKLVEELSNKKYGNMKFDIRDALFKEDSVLKKFQREYINDKIDNLLKHENPRIQKRAKELSFRSY